VIIKDKQLKKDVDVCDKDCPNKKCYHPHFIQGFVQPGRGMIYYPKDMQKWKCLTRENSGCPDKV
jgi:hypothetical protein